MYDNPLHVAYIRVNPWMHAVEQQLTRALDEGAHSTTRMRDIDFFVIALNRLRTAVEDAKVRINDGRIKPALQAFDQAVPDLVALRDIAEHFEKYDWGIGRLVKKNRLTDEAPGYEYGALDAGITYRGRRLYLVGATKAARDLHAVMMTVLADAGREITLAREWPLITWPPS